MERRPLKICPKTGDKCDCNDVEAFVNCPVTGTLEEDFDQWVDFQAHGGPSD